MGDAILPWQHKTMGRHHRGAAPPFCYPFSLSPSLGDLHSIHVDRHGIPLVVNHHP